MELIAFTTPAPVRVFADLQFGTIWQLSFKLEDPESVVLDSLTPGKWNSWERADELWKTTCLEAFFAVPGEKSYWELNLSPARKLWNLYRFNAYREPQPPHASNDFELNDISATHDSLVCHLIPRVNLSEVEISLTAIVRTAGGPHYFALKHAGAKPDFHLRASFKR